MPVHFHYVVALVIAPVAFGYSVLTHEALIDAAWDDSIRPALLARFPKATKEDLRIAHAHAYGGAIVQDLGYYSVGSRLFSDMTHYVRSGDFIMNLIESAETLDEYAFAIGSLAHYSADTLGHRAGVNRAVAAMYPKLRRKYGDSVTYEDNPGAHMKVEFAFDVARVANGHYAPDAYHDFIGFKVAKPVIERAFQKTYGLKLDDVMVSVDLALGSYRYSVGTLLPQMTKVAWSIKGSELQKANPGTTREKFVYNLSRAAFEKEWGRDYRRPGIFARILGWLFRVMPKVGPLRAFAFKAPTPEAENLLMASFNAALDQYRKSVAQVRRAEPLRLLNENLDTGGPVVPGKYKLADEAYGKLLEKLEKR